MIKKAKSWLQKNWQNIFVVFLAIIFFLATASFNFYTQKTNFVKWLSPDETANYTFTKLYAQTGNLSLSEPINYKVNDIIHPRSFRAENGQLKPMSFLGIIIIFGKIASLTSIKVIPYLTPIFGAIGIIFFYLLIKLLFDRRVGLISASILTFFPPYIYYSCRSMFHNILFVSLLIIGLFYSVRMNKKISVDLKDESSLSYLGRKFIYPGLAGLFIGAAIATRSSELLWLAPLLLFLWVFNIKRTGITKLLVLVSFLILSFLPVFYWNQILYNSPINSGYPEMNTSINTLKQTSTELVSKASVNTQKSIFSQKKELVTKIKDTIFYFGFDKHKSLKMFYYYFFKMFQWLFLMGALGFLLFLIKYKRITKGQVLFILGWSIITLILVYYYGSWEFHDNPDPKQTTIGNSYTRYWLPIYLGFIPLASIFIVRMSRLLKNKLAINILRFITVAIIIYFSSKFVLFGSEEGLVISAQKLIASQHELEDVLSITSSDSVIISRYHDKLFYPERKVILGLFNDDNMNQEYAKLIKYLPVYYYNFTLPPKDINYLNVSKLARASMQISNVQQVTKDFTLYKLSIKK